MPVLSRELSESPQTVSTDSFHFPQTVLTMHALASKAVTKGRFKAKRKKIWKFHIFVISPIFPYVEISKKVFSIFEPLTKDRELSARSPFYYEVEENATCIKKFKRCLRSFVTFFFTQVILLQRHDTN